MPASALICMLSRHHPPFLERPYATNPLKADMETCIYELYTNKSRLKREINVSA